mmetsp:Transcript_34691/g.87198  ORF Transcript_34691/g.87198 Transcript_34691/m.87198 type:complete len:120 (-) Transcript_34691:687-1046(-)
MYGGVEYGMNEFAGGWVSCHRQSSTTRSAVVLHPISCSQWLNSLYTWLDPDLVTFAGDFWFRPWAANVSKGFSISMDSRSRVAKAVVYGGIFKNGYDLYNGLWAPVAHAVRPHSAPAHT